ncbi:MAG TPA: polyamine aminopropyltransferase [Dehalococcoidia bacterium]
MTDGGLWFGEPPQAGQQPLLLVRASLHRRRSRYQTIEVLETALFGRTLVLDQIIQTTERDEFFYHEMLVHPAMTAHPAPRRVLVIGGGDGGALRRVLEHGVEHATLVEIDPEVVEVSRQHLPSVSAGAFDDPRAELVFQDGYAFVEERAAARSAPRYDVVIVDAPDPIGPGKRLFTPAFYRALHDVLTEDGLAVVQSESPLLMATQTAATFLHLRGAFPTARTYLGAVPAYPGVLWSFTIGSRRHDPAAVEPAELERRVQERGLLTQYYTPAVHRAAFALPAFLERFLADSAAAGEPADRHPFFPVAQGITVAEPPPGG